MNLDTEQYLKSKNFRVFIPETLFPLNWEALKLKRCPVCGCKLYLPRDNKSMVYCKSKKHKKFFIRYEAFKRLTTDGQ